MPEFTVNDRHYRSRKLNARQQFHVARRLGPLFGQLVALAPSLAQLSTDGMSDPDVAKNVETAVETFALALARIPDADCDYVLDRCMEATQVMTGGNGVGQVWTDLWNPRAGRSQVDIDMSEMMQIASEVLRDNLGSFFNMLPASAPATVAATPASPS
jgi:hypothetical protein